MYDEKSAEPEIHLAELLRFTATRWPVLLAAAVLCASIGFLVPGSAGHGTWEAAGNLMLYADIPPTEGISPTEEHQRLANTAAVLIASYRVYEAALARMDSDMTPAQLAQYVSVGANARMLYVAVTHSDRAFAEQAATAIRAVAPAIVGETLDGVELMPFGAVYANGADETLGNRRTHALTGGVLGLTAAFLMVVFREVMHPAVKSGAELERLTGVPVLGIIPSENSRVREIAHARKGGRA